MGDLSQPVVFITTLQPFLLLWVASVCFFLTLAAVAIISKGKHWYELGCLFVLIFAVTTVVGLYGTSWFMGLKIYDVEIIRYTVGY